MGAWDSLDSLGKPLLSDDAFRRFCALVHDGTGLSFSDSSRFFVEKRLENRLEALGGIQPEDYIHFLLYDHEKEQEWGRLIDLLTTNETYFMREERQLKCFQKDILPLLAKQKPDRKIRVWSAGCSTGEEPYSIVILLHESGLFKDSEVEIMATDINTRVLTRAREGLYTESSFRAVDDAFKNRWFRKESDGRFRISDEIRRMVKFSRFNLFDLDRYSLFSPFDVIFCRNVIIYFDIEAKVKVIERFWDKMREGGYLLLGHSESLISITDKFKLVHLPSDLVYTKATQ